MAVSSAWPVASGRKPARTDIANRRRRILFRGGLRFKLAALDAKRECLSLGFAEFVRSPRRPTLPCQHRAQAATLARQDDPIWRREER
jgi:hypothetical protein